MNSGHGLLRTARLSKAVTPSSTGAAAPARLLNGRHAPHMGGRYLIRWGLWEGEDKFFLRLLLFLRPNIKTKSVTPGFVVL